MEGYLHIYTRVSTSVQEENGTSLETQKEFGIKKATDLGFKHQLWNEGGASSASDDLKNRPVLVRLLSEIDKGKIKNIFVYHHDRLSRNEITAATIRLKLQSKNVTLYTASGSYDLNNPYDKLVKSLMDSISQFDNSLRSERSRLGKISKIKSGGWMGGPPPYGFKIENKKLVLNSHESENVYSIFDKFSKGVPINKIRLFLNSNNVLTRRHNKFWSTGSILKILKNTHHVGYYHYYDKKFNVRIKVKCPNIVSENLWLECQKRIDKQKKKKGQINKTKHFYLLRNHMNCGHCNQNITGRTNNKGESLHYYCPSNERKWKTSDSEDKWVRHRYCDLQKSLSIRATDEFIIKHILKLLRNSKILNKIVHNTNITLTEDIHVLRKSYQALKSEINSIENSISQREVDNMFTENNSLEIKIIERLKKRHHDKKSELHIIETRLNNVLNCFNPDDYCFDYEQQYCALIKDDFDPIGIKSYKRLTDEIIDNITVKYDSNDDIHLIDVNIHLLCMKKNKGLQYSNGIQSKKYCHGGINQKKDRGMTIPLF